MLRERFQPYNLLPGELPNVGCLLSYGKNIPNKNITRTVTRKQGFYCNKIIYGFLFP